VDPATNIVTLSGDHGSSQNSYHVLTAPSTASGVQYVTGCTIRDGAAEDPSGGFNPGRYGGGLFVDGATVYVADCRFTLNYAAKASGAIYNAEDATTTVVRTEFVQNTAELCGGAIANGDTGYNGGLSSSNGYVEVWDSFFQLNSTGDTGGALFGGAASTIFDTENVTLVVNSRFLQNDAPNGGAIGLQTGARPPAITIYSSRIYDNTATVGGGIYIPRGPSDLLPTDVTIINSSFCSNAAGDRGGAIFIEPMPDPDGPTSDAVDVGIINCTFTGNTAATPLGGGSLFAGSGHIGIVNNIKWGNLAFGSANQIGLGSPAPSIIVTYTDIEGGWAGTGNVADDPKFGTIAACDVPLSALSPGSIINMSNMASIPLDYLDIDDDGDTTERLPDVLLGARVIGSGADFGANEDR